MAAQRHGMLAAVGGMVAFAASLAPECAAQVAVFAPGTEKAYMDKVNARLAGLQPQAQTQSNRFDIRARWADGGAIGDPISLTYSLIPDGLVLPDTIAGPKDPEGPSELFDGFDDKFENQRAFWLSLFDGCFEGEFIDSWGLISGITFTRVTALPTDPDGPGPLPEVPSDWDDGAAWGTPGPIGGGDPTHGDIRIGAKFIDGIGGVFGYAFPPDDANYPGEIVLDIDEVWEDPSFGYRRLVNVMSHLIGIAIGLDVVCPDDDTKIMEPIEDEQDMQGPQLDDIRGVNALYGDRLENNDLLDTGSAVELVFDPVASLLGQQFGYSVLSIDSQADKDFFFVVIPPELADSEGKVDVDVRIQAIPIGNAYKVGPDNNGACGGVTTEDVDALIAQDLRVSLRDSEGVSVPVYFDITGDEVEPDVAGYINENDPGIEELIVGNISVPGTYFIEISSAQAEDPASPQLYDLNIQLGNTIFSDGMPTDVLVALPSPNGLGGSYITNQPDMGLVPEGQDVYTGRRATVGQLDATFPSLNHHALITPDANTPNTRNFAQMRIAWPGGATSRPAVGDVSVGASNSEADSVEHATAAATAAVGNPEGVFPSGSLGVAYESSLIAGSIATRIVPSGFLLERESLAYALFTMTSPTYAAAAGLPTTATVLSLPFGFPGDLRGDTYISQMCDAVVFMNRVPIVTGTGNDGGQDQTSECGGAGGNVPGGEFRGSRTATAPGTAFNVIAAGAGAKALPEETPANIDFVNPSIDGITIVPDISGKGPIDTYNFTTATLDLNTRPGVDIMVPGTGYVIVAPDPQELDPPAPPCSYPGHLSVISLTAPDLNPAFDTDLDNPSQPDRYTGIAGTSLSSGYTAGAVALLEDYALAQNPPLDISPVVIRAILLAGATPQLGWTNTTSPARPQDNRDGDESIVDDPNTGDSELNPALYEKNGTRPMDYAQGAGLLNLENSYSIYRGAHVNPLRALFVPVTPGTETQDSFFTDPTKPTITDPPRELSDINPSPFGRAQSSVASAALPTMSVDDLPPSPIEISKMFFEANANMSNSTIMHEHADFGDAKLDDVNPEKGAGGASFTGRPPYKLPSSPGGGRPGVNPAAPAPTELPGKITVGPIGWDHGMIGQRIMSLPAKQPAFPTAGPVRTGYIDYFIAFPFGGDENFQCALTWLRTARMALPNFSNPDNPQIGAITSLELENLDVQLISCDSIGEILDDHVFLGKIGEDDGGQLFDSSNALNGTVEFFSSKPQAGFYVLRVRWIASNYDLFKNEIDGNTEFGLAWITDFFGGLGLPVEDDETRSATNAAAVARSNENVSTRVADMLIKSAGSKRGDARFNPAFDVDRDNRITVRDFLKVTKFWSGR